MFGGSEVVNEKLEWDHLLLLNSDWTWSKVNVLGKVIQRGAFAINTKRTIFVTKVFLQKSFSGPQQPEITNNRLNSDNIFVHLGEFRLNFRHRRVAKGAQVGPLIPKLRSHIRQIRKSAKCQMKTKKSGQPSFSKHLQMDRTDSSSHQITEVYFVSALSSKEKERTSCMATSDICPLQDSVSAGSFPEIATGNSNQTETELNNVCACVRLWRVNARVWNRTWRNR